MQNKIIPSLLITVGFLIATPILAQSNTDTTPQADYGVVTIVSISGPVFPTVLSNRLELSDQQRGQIHDILYGTQAQLDKLTVEMQQNQAAISEMIQNNYSHRKLGKLTKQQGKIYGQQLEIQLETKHNIMAVLTPLQQQKVQTFKQIKDNHVM
jgi:hypothetical protein